MLLIFMNTNFSLKLKKPFPKMWATYASPFSGSFSISSSKDGLITGYLIVKSTSFVANKKFPASNEIQVALKIVRTLLWPNLVFQKSIENIF